MVSKKTEKIDVGDHHFGADIKGNGLPSANSVREFFEWLCEYMFRSNSQSNRNSEVVVRCFDLTIKSIVRSKHLKWNHETIDDVTTYKTVWQSKSNK